MNALKQNWKTYTLAVRKIDVSRYNGAHLSASLKFFNTIVLRYAGVFKGAVNWSPMMPRDEISLISCFSCLALIEAQIWSI